MPLSDLSLLLQKGCSSSNFGTITPLPNLADLRKSAQEINRSHANLLAPQQH